MNRPIQKLVEYFDSDDSDNEDAPRMNSSSNITTAKNQDVQQPNTVFAAPSVLKTSEPDKSTVKDVATVSSDPMDLDVGTKAPGVSPKDLDVVMKASQWIQ